MRGDRDPVTKLYNINILQEKIMTELEILTKILRATFMNVNQKET